MIRFNMISEEKYRNGINCRR